MMHDQGLETIELKLCSISNSISSGNSNFRMETAHICCVAALIWSIFLLSYWTASSSSLSSSVNTAEVLDRLTKLEAGSGNQDGRLSHLELKSKQSETKIDGLEAKILRLVEKDSYENTDLATGIENREKRSARLFPARVLYGNPRNKTPTPIFPSNCNDLNELGHTANGFYLVQGPNKNKVGVTYCSFEQEHYRPEMPVGKFFGYVDVKSSGVQYFYVQRDSSKFRHTKTSEVVRYNVQKFNTGNAMNLTTGVFTAPVNGTYQFHFTGHREVFIPNAAFMTTFLGVRIRLNGKDVADSHTAAVGSSLVSCHSILKLKVGDRVDVFKTGGFFSLHSDRVTQFIGHLLEEDLIF